MSLARLVYRLGRNASPIRYAVDPAVANYLALATRAMEFHNCTGRRLRL